MSRLQKKAIKSLAKMITQSEGCKSFCFNYSEMFLEIILKLILKEEISEEEIDSLSTIISLGERTRD